MRPVNKGVVSKVYTDYKMAKWDLVKRLGNYCSYCEMNTDNQNDVEHVVSKSKDNSLKLSWENFLIGCKTCNIIKSDITENRNDYPFPDEYNTAYLFTYKNGKVRIREDLTMEDKEKAENLFNLVKLDRDKNTSGQPDDRFMARIKAYTKAQESLEDYKALPKPEMVKQIGRSPEGFFSVWVEVFKDYPEVKKEILKTVPGTAMECYDDDCNPKKSINRM